MLSAGSADLSSEVWVLTSEYWALGSDTASSDLSISVLGTRYSVLAFPDSELPTTSTATFPSPRFREVSRMDATEFTAKANELDVSSKQQGRAVSGWLA